MVLILGPVERVCQNVLVLDEEVPEFNSRKFSALNGLLVCLYLSLSLFETAECVKFLLDCSSVRADLVQVQFYQPSTNTNAFNGDILLFGSFVKSLKHSLEVHHQCV